MKTTAPRLLALLPALAAFVLLSAFACAGNNQGAGGEISQERAIELARAHVTFEPREVEAEKVTEQGRPVWKVTFRGEPLGPTHPMGELTVVYIDRETGEVVSLAMT